MVNEAATTEPPVPINLKDPAVAALLAWLVPGLGHLYQGRTGKAAIFFICLMGIFVYGCYLGGSRELGYARVVYVAWEGDDARLPFLCQLGMGLPTMPAWIQANLVSRGNAPLFGGFMAPPTWKGGPTLDDLQLTLHNYFELGTVYTMIAGLLNILAIYDAWGGPVFPEEPKKKDEDQDGPGEKPARESKPSGQAKRP